MKLTLRPLTLLVLLTLAITAHAQEDEHYDEMFEADGTVRAHYAEVYRIFAEYSLAKRNRISKQTVADFHGDNALLPLPRLLPREEYETLRRGVEQRATALRMFLQDYYSGKNRAIKAGAIPLDVVERAIRRSGEGAWLGHVDPDTIAFLYGPDIVRDNKGNFRSVEDNSNFIGGVGDLVIARETLFRHAPEYEDAIAAPDPESFYKRVAARARARAVPRGGKLVLVQYAHAYASDEEDTRTAKLFEDLGFEVVHISRERTIDKRFKKRLVTTKKGVFLETTSARGNKIRQRVGFVFSHVEPGELDASHPASHRQKVIKTMQEYLVDEGLPAEVRKKIEENMDDAQALEKIGDEYHGSNKWLGGEGVPGLYQALFDGKVAMNVSPGNEFVNDKEFYMHVDKLIRFYLKEEPIVKNIATQSFGKSRGLLDKVFANIDAYVVKRVDGRGGDAVWVGPKMDKRGLKKLRRMIEAEPASFIAQRYTPLSVLDNHIVDLRLISDVTPTSVFVTETPWGRAAPVGGDGKVNISLRGSETAVFVVDPPGRCSEGMSELLLTAP